MDKEARMTYALEDIEKYAHDLERSAATMDLLAQALMDVPNADDALRTAEGFAEAYRTIANELKRQTARGLGKNV